MSTDGLTVFVRTDTHGGLEDTRLGVVRRTLALWCLSVASRLLRTRIDISITDHR